MITQEKKIDAVEKTIRWALDEATEAADDGNPAAATHAIRTAALTIVMMLDLLAEAGE